MGAAEPCEICITRGICSNKTLRQAMSQCPLYFKYIERMSKLDSGFAFMMRMYEDEMLTLKDGNKP